MNRRQFKTEDFMKFKFVNDPQLSPDNKKILYVISKSEKEKYLSNIWIYDLSDKSEKQFTFGNSDKLPRFSPNGKSIAFVSKRSGENQLYVMPLCGGEAVQAVEFRYGVREFVWSPDGKKIAFTANTLVGQTVDDLLKLEEDDRDKEVKKQNDVYRKITNMKYKMNGIPGLGIIGEKNTHIFVLDIASKEIESITDGSRNESTPVWHPNNKGLVFTANREDDYDQNPRINDLYYVDLATKTPKKLTASDGTYALPEYSSDGKWLTFYGNKSEFGSATNNTLYLLNTVNGEIKDLLPNFDQSLGISAALDMKLNAPVAGPVFSKDNQYIYVTSSYHGSTHFYKVTRASGEIKQITQGVLQINNYCINNKKAAIMYSGELFPTDLALVDLENGEVERLTEINKEILEECFVSQPEEFWYKSFDGTKIQGWLQKPYGFEEDKKYPLVIHVHGGPHVMFTPSFFFELHLMNSEGYVMLYVNPRGSQGYGQEFTDAVRGDYGGGDFKDILSAVDYAATLPYVDETNMGITGGSYGGFMTNWALGNTNKFKAGVTLRSISNWVSFYGVSDIGYTFCEGEIGTTPWGNVSKMWDQSPLKYVEKVNAPLLMIHGEEDFRCPIEQAEQFYIFLKRLGKKVELLRFPHENHELSRSGAPKRRMARLDAIVDWFNDHLERN